MNVKPLHDRLIVARIEEGEQKVGGIIIPDSAKEKPMRGTVIAAGSGRWNDDGLRVPPGCSPYSIGSPPDSLLANTISWPPHAIPRTSWN
jgi:hypothetical protein